MSRFEDGSSFVGQWRDGQRDGVGVELTAEGARYMGGWRQGLREGFGVLTLHGAPGKGGQGGSAGGAVWGTVAGEWAGGEPSGHAVCEVVTAGEVVDRWSEATEVAAAARRVRHVGEWLRGRAHGFGLRQAWLRAAEGGSGRGDGAREVAGAVEHVGWWRHGRPIGQSLAAALRPPWRGGQRVPDGPPHAAAQAPRPGTRKGSEEEAALEAARGAKAV